MPITRTSVPVATSTENPWEDLGSIGATIALQGSPAPANWTSVGNLGASHTVEGKTRSVGTLNADVEITADFSNNEDALLLLIQDGTGGRDATWVDIDVWMTPTGAPPALKVAAGASDLISLWRAGGVTYGLHYGETGPAGDDGDAGPVGITWRRAYDSDNTYAIRDVVYHNGSSYIALLPSSPSDVQQPDLSPNYWGVLAAAGVSSGSAGVSSVYDNFTRADNADINVGAPWVYAMTSGVLSDLEIVSNKLHVVGSGGVKKRVRADYVLPSADHWAKLTIGSITWASGQQMLINAGVRYDASLNTGYFVGLTTYTSHTKWQMWITKYVNSGSDVPLAFGAEITPAPVAGDTIKVTVVGNVVTGYYNDVQHVQITDSDIAAGVRAGMMLQRTTGQFTISEFRVGT